MNRIILIGNGFDLAHGLKTSYQNFIDWYWAQWKEKLATSSKLNEKDELCSFSLKRLTGVKLWKNFQDFLESRPSISKVYELERFINECTYEESDLMKAIRSALSTVNWVDIENEYYKLLKECRTLDTRKFNNNNLNDQLQCLKEQLIAYLSFIYKDPQIDLHIMDKIYNPFNPNDISIEGKSKFISHIDYWLNCNEEEWKYRFKQYDTDNFDQIEIEENIKRIKQEIGKNKFNYLTYRRYPYEILYPDNILLLNFNYTNTAQLYLKNKSIFQLNHIHGRLDDPESIIFGYGDELDDEYETIKKRNNNELLKNMKTSRYCETANYRNILSFIESAPYQILIMGHSCGNSDRTLLNTLFEHDNCVSIKPYYHKKDDGKDNYLELIQNISRNFTDMKKMRDRVVNKTFCEPLINNKNVL